MALYGASNDLENDLRLVGVDELQVVENDDKAGRFATSLTQSLG
jgi:hypothetical protein